MVEDLTELNVWAREHHTRVAVVDEDWQSITYEADATVDGLPVRRRCRHVLPLGLALRRWARTYVIGLWHTASDGAECYHVREVIPPCLTGSEGMARSLAVTTAGALVEDDRRDHCGATAANLRTYVVERAANWHS